MRYGYYIPTEDDNYIEWCESNNLDPYESGSEEEWKIVRDDILESENIDRQSD